ncbi:helix-turn-helix domain-containing protein [Variovorax sp. GT1P44]|uniref:helix-turn-helix domain-containing protein n=1 Tax=Variovorax sp. GT1P44 TaxID=3443742 RepID=UPI003F4767DB
MSIEPNAILRACQRLGSQAALARELNVTPAAVNQWVSGVRQVPAEQCPVIERVTQGAVSCESLRPDVAWDVLRMQAEPEAKAA